MQNPLRQKLRNKHICYGLWVSLESPTITEIAATLGLDWVCIDAEHGSLDYKEIIEHIRAARGSETAVIVRVPELQVTMLKRALDIGAHGVIVPAINTAAEAEAAVQYGKYPPRGVRGIGGERAVRWGIFSQEYLASANEETLVIPLIESRAAVENIDAILETPNLEAIYLGLADMSASYGYPGQWDAPGIPEHTQAVCQKALAKGAAPGILARNPAEAEARAAQGFQWICLGSDTGLLIDGIKERMKALELPLSPRY